MREVNWEQNGALPSSIEAFDLAEMTHAEQMMLLIKNIHRPEVLPMAAAILLFKQTEFALVNAHRVLAEVRRDFPNLMK